MTIQAGRPGTEGRRCAVVLLRRPADPRDAATEVRVSVAGSADSGKSTLVAVEWDIPQFTKNQETARIQVAKEQFLAVISANITFPKNPRKVINAVFAGRCFRGR